ncbi:MBL fold metallo-hydrolase [Streptantibioticus ferralitis]|uniref:MBL fold metallo-hydrolase n=1 Tax=Streptantibioticus ferralitis TaxID=236510 RepID=A0ABT5YVZ9_9ACTN|nr:MBL fold metallo-hydrolase [Streptantibioticus ferralitis]MDF2255773.1 MBL fold metallo-hydrolase [Streptantibioticus ferralitis]
MQHDAMRAGHQDKEALVELADGVLAYVRPRGGWCVSNAGVLVGRDAVTLIDCTATESSARRLRSAIGEHTPSQVGTMVVTHHHGDHHGGAAVFGPGLTVVAHERTRETMLREGLNLPSIWPDVHWGDIRLVPPQVTFTDRLTLHVDELRVELIHLGPAHTTGDVVAWLPEQRVLFTGDLTFSQGTPFCLAGSLDGTLEVLRALRELDAEVVVSGHGPVSGPEVIDANAEYLRWVRELAVEGFAAGREPFEVAREAELGAFAELLEPERLVANLHRAYAELRGEPRGVELPLPSILREMISFNGGQPLACLA